MTDLDSVSADYTLRPSELAATLALLVEARQPTILWGAPGYAKSALAQQTAAEAARRYVDVRALLLDPVDLRGIPWPAASGLFDEAIGATGSFLAIADGTTQNDALFAQFCSRGERHWYLERDYYRDYYPIDERLPRIRKLPDGRLTPVPSLSTEAERRTSAIRSSAASKERRRRRARAAASAPSAVGRTPVGRRSNTGAPKRVSSRAMARVSAGWVIPSRCAAATIFPASATVTSFPARCAARTWRRASHGRAAGSNTEYQ